MGFLFTHLLEAMKRFLLRETQRRSLIDTICEFEKPEQKLFLRSYHQENLLKNELSPTTS